MKTRQLKITRGNFVAGTASIAIVGAPSIVRAASTPLKVTILPLTECAPLMAAVKFGYFIAENIDLQPQMVTGGAVAIPGLVAGDFDIINSNPPSIFSAIARGLDLRILMECQHIATKPPDSGALFRRKGEPLRSGKDLEGKTLGVNAIRDWQWAVIRSWIKLTGGNPDNVDFREVPLPQMVDAIKGKQIDTALILDPFLSIALADPALELLAWPLSKVVPNVPATAYAITGQTAAQRAPLMRAFLRAYRKGVAWSNANLGKQPYLEIIESYTKIKPEVAAKMVFVPSPSNVDPAGFEKINNLMFDNGLLTSRIDVRSKIFNG
jgi:NitT/TauT family transport system substrate-binding protein